MAFDIRTFKIGESRIRKAEKLNFFINGDGKLEAEKGEDTHGIIFTKIDSGEKNTKWGRLKLYIDVAEDAIFTVHIFAGENSLFLRRGVETAYDEFITSSENSFAKKLQLFQLSGAKSFDNEKDMLLSGIEGRYLWIYIEVHGTNDCVLSGAEIYNPGELFLKLFPEIYRNENEFFPRYLSIFSAMNMDFKKNIQRLINNLDVEKAPLEVLAVFAKWLGIIADGEFLGEEKMRKLLKNAYNLSRIKGTKKAIVEVTKILIDSEPMVVEQCQIKYMHQEDRSTYEKLYGINPMSFTVLLHEPADEKLYARLKYLIEQFKPARSVVQIVFLGQAGNMDSFCYLGVNATICDYRECTLDEGYFLGQNLKME